MKLKKYQQSAMESVSRYFTACVQQNAATAFEQIQPELRYKIPSSHVHLKGIPYVCVRIPTGGGKTLLAAHSIAQVATDYLHCDFPITLWLVPSKTIKSQTVEALKNPQHPYRAALDKAFNRQVKVIESEEFVQITPQDLSNKAIVVVSTLQNFRVEEKDGRKIYAFNENLTAHFERIPEQVQSVLDKVSESDLQENGLQSKQLGKVKCSFANLLKAYRPLIIVDEAHNARTSLTFDVLANLMPSAILEFTATPNQDSNTGSNILYHVSAGALKAEEMIKLPIMLREHKTWQQAVDNAVIERNSLAQKAQNELDYIRPIVLFQAAPKNGEVTVEVLKRYLMEDLSLDEAQIAIVTGCQHELDNINIASRDCPINYVITVEALKEGWDCPFAYVFCSVQNVSSSKEAEQLLGRVLRMPYAKRRTIEDLNRAYAHLSSPNFGVTARSLEDRLIAMGFEALEVAQMLKTPEQMQIDGYDDLSLFMPTAPQSVFELRKMPDVAKLSETEYNQLKITEQSGENGTVFLLQVQGNVNKNLHKVIVQTATGKAKEKLENSIQIHNAKVAQQASPAERDEVFPAIPQLCLAIQQELELAEPDLLLDYYGWNLLDYPAKLESFQAKDESQKFEIDVENNRVAYYTQQAEQLAFADDWLDMTENEFVCWLDKQLKLTDVSQEKSLAFLRLLVSDLLAKPQFSLTGLVRQKFNLVREIKELINRYRQQALNRHYQASLFGENDDVKVCLDERFQFEITPEHFVPQPPFYNGRYKFQKHYFAQIEDLKNKGEEFDCAMIIDNLLQVKYWLRNPVHRGFGLPLSDRNFYPDFIAVLNDGRILVVEYKGEPYKTNDDSKEKCLIAERWEQLSNGKCLFVMAVEKDDFGRDVRTQLLNKIS
ncbi:DEAD/DEAH box helicase [Actinobacillus equuli]|uniref:DEAD/DEAH box helicase n=1 Tax=Actinobacillus equuli TaxID=718 RepID=UPI002443173C|nr:DEAD/DEAH box helicase family protein [Actinobacillus equuli]WGE41431.1 DEAD/DEAH box helicase family protein [Actinobacillus equuli subsp. haemolyticus]